MTGPPPPVPARPPATGASRPSCSAMRLGGPALSDRRVCSAADSLAAAAAVSAGPESGGQQPPRQTARRAPFDQPPAARQLPPPGQCPLRTKCANGGGCSAAALISCRDSWPPPAEYRGVRAARRSGTALPGLAGAPSGHRVGRKRMARSRGQREWKRVTSGQLLDWRRVTPGRAATTESSRVAKTPGTRQKPTS